MAGSSSSARRLQKTEVNACEKGGEMKENSMMLHINLSVLSLTTQNWELLFPLYDLSSPLFHTQG